MAVTESALPRSLKTKIVALALLEGVPVITMLATLATIYSVLGYAASASTDAEKRASLPIVIICIAIGVIGCSALVYQIRQIYNKKIARDHLLPLFLEGMKLRDDDPEKQAWRAKVENALRQYLDESYVARFKAFQSGSEQWGLDQFLQEIK